MVRFLIAVLFTLGLAGCSSTLKPVKPDPATGLFPTQTQVVATDILIAEPFQQAWKKMLHLKVDAQPVNPTFMTYFMTSIQDMNTFEKVMTKNELQIMVIEQQLQDKVPSVSDLLGLNALQKQIGSFLILEVDAIWKGGYDFEGSMQAVDPASGKTVFKYATKAFNWAGLDGPLYRPMLNAFVLWTQDRLPAHGASAASGAAASAPK